MTWRIPRPRSTDVLVDGNGVISYAFQKWLDKLTGRLDNEVRSFVAGDKVQPSDWMILADATAGAFTIDLPPAKESKGRWLTIKKIDFVPANMVTIKPFGSEQVDFGASTTLTATNQSKTLICDGTYWWIM